VELGTESGTICCEVERPAMARSTAMGAKERMAEVLYVYTGRLVDGSEGEKMAA